MRPLTDKTPTFYSKWVHLLDSQNLKSFWQLLFPFAWNCCLAGGKKENPGPKTNYAQKLLLLTQSSMKKNKDRLCFAFHGRKLLVAPHHVEKKPIFHLTFSHLDTLLLTLRGYILHYSVWQNCCWYPQAWAMLMLCPNFPTLLDSTDIKPSVESRVTK